MYRTTSGLTPGDQEELVYGVHVVHVIFERGVQ